MDIKYTVVSKFLSLIAGRMPADPDLAHLYFFLSNNKEHFECEGVSHFQSAMSSLESETSPSSVF